MTASWPALLLAAGGGLGATLAVRLAVRPLAPVALPPRGQAAVIASRILPASGPNSVAAAIVRRDPFRISHEPPPLAYDPMHLAQQSAPPAANPTLRLVGLVAARDPTAVIEGFPGVVGARVLRAGDEVAGLRVLRIDGKQVKVAGMDTTWMLQVREPWK